MVYFQLLSLIWAGAKDPISSLKANSRLVSYAASSSGSFPDRLNSLSGERKRVKGDLRTETFVLHSKLSQAQRLDLDIVHIINQKKSFFCQLHILTEHHLLAASFRIQAMQERSKSHCFHCPLVRAERNKVYLVSNFCVQAS